MIREIINFTNDLIEDIPDIMEWKVQPSKGLHVFIDIDDKGQWVNQNLQKGKDYDYYDGKSELTSFLQRTKPYFINSLLANKDMNKCLDNDKCVIDNFIFPIKQIQSCSPYVIGFKRKEEIQEIKIADNKNITIEKDRFDVITQRAKVYLPKASTVCAIAETYKDIVVAFSEKFDDIIAAVKSLKITIGKKEVLVNKLSKDDFIMIYLSNIPKMELERTYNKYLTDKLFLKNDYNSTAKNITDDTYGLPSYKIVDNEDKIFLKHLTGFQYLGINQRLSATDLKLFYRFIFLSENGVFPNPLPIIIDKNEITGKLIRIFKDQGFSNFKYAEMIKHIFDNTNDKTKLHKYYLLNRKGGNVVDFDFVPMFRYFINCKIYNCTELKDKNGDIKPLKYVLNVFDLERVFNDLFLKYDNNTKRGFGFLIGNYFGDKLESQNSFKKYTVTNETSASFYKYRKSIYDYIYKSRLQSIISDMFEEMVYTAILSDFTMDEFKNGKHSKYYSIREKVNILFSLYDLFNNNKKSTILMNSKIETLKEKVRKIAEHETAHIESDEEFAFAAGQVVSYLLEQSEASNKTYAMLEPFLQKKESGSLQDEIIRIIEIYKHKIKFYNGKKYSFELLSADVLTYGKTLKMESLRKFFIAGCFTPSVFRLKE
jgi:CRISPR-associated protein Csh1